MAFTLIPRRRPVEGGGPTMEPVLFDTGSLVTVTKPGVDSSWEDVDVSGTVPSGATGVLLLVQKASTTDTAFGLRKNGSTQDITFSADHDNSRQEVYAVGLDANRVFEAYNTAWAEITAFKIVGYYMSTVFPDPWPSVGAVPAAVDTWYDRDLTATTGSSPTAVILSVGNNGAATRIASARPDGSTNGFFTPARTRTHAFIAAPSGIIEISGNVNVAGYLGYIVGYASEGHDMLVNEVAVTPGSLSTWTEDDLGAGGLAGIYRISTGTSGDVDFRTPGSAGIGPERAYQCGYMIVKADSNNKVEIWTDNATVSIYRTGRLVAI